MNFSKMYHICYIYLIYIISHPLIRISQLFVTKRIIFALKVPSFKNLYLAFFPSNRAQATNVIPIPQNLRYRRLIKQKRHGFTTMPLILSKQKTFRLSPLIF